MDLADCQGNLHLGLLPGEDAHTSLGHEQRRLHSDDVLMHRDIVWELALAHIGVLPTSASAIGVVVIDLFASRRDSPIDPDRGRKRGAAG